MQQFINQYLKFPSENISKKKFYMNTGNYMILTKYLFNFLFYRKDFNKEVLYEFWQLHDFYLIVFLQKGFQQRSFI